jgi:ParB family chromosome partitioning protein
MMGDEDLPTIAMIPVDQINVLNPRARNQRVFREIVSNISNLGLKRPITVSRRRDAANGLPFDLVCGQGRLEAYFALGQPEIPAIVVEAPEDECLLMSLIENLARRHHRPLELISAINVLKERGYSDRDIAAKTDLSFEYVRGVGRLLKQGEERLIEAVEAGQVPLTVAIQIAETDGEGIQLALTQAYESNVLRGKKLMAAKRLVEQRKHRGKGLRQGGPRKKVRPISSDTLVRVYQQEVERQACVPGRGVAVGNRLAVATATSLA